MATEQNLEFRLGEDWDIELAVRDPNDLPYDPPPTDVKFRLASDTAKLVDVSLLGDGVEWANASLGYAVIRVTPAMQADITPGLYQYEAQAVLEDGEVTDQAFGSFHARESLFVKFA